jgi:hypothetical protein
MLWFPPGFQFSTADVGLFAVILLASGNVIGAVLLALVNRSGFLPFRDGTPYLESWAVICLVSTSLLLGFVQWFALGKLLGLWIERRRKKRE